jgi:hypothetical protein
VRPYPAKVAGVPLSFEYESDTGEFTFTFKNVRPVSRKRLVIGHGVQGGTSPAQIRSRETELFVPLSLAHGRVMIVSGLGMGDKYAYDERLQTLFIVHHDQAADAVHTVRVSFNPPLSKHQPSTVSFLRLTAMVAVLSLCLGYILLELRE